MKKVGALLISLLLAASVLCACRRGDEPPFDPASATEEYARIYPNGQAFDFDAVQTFTRTSTIHVSGDALTAEDPHGRPYYPTNEVEEYKYENKNGVVRSQRTLRHVYAFDSPTNRPKYAPYSREIYADGTLFYVHMDDEGEQLDEPVTPEKVYADRAEYLDDSRRCFDANLQRVVPYDLTLFSSFTGQKERNTYCMTGIVDVAGHGEAFFDAFAANYTFKTWYTPVADTRIYEYFLNPDFFSSNTRIKVEITSDRNGLRSVTETFETIAWERPIQAIKDTPIRITCSTEYSTGAFSEEIITPQLAA
ncbi:MAG: hypothetical protein K2M95_07055 [Clostridiales bacterium]|nr:hypothetical protein [Clostridiales bacterium]